MNLIRETRMGADAKIDLKQVRVRLAVPRVWDSIVRRHTDAQTLANKEEPGEDFKPRSGLGLASDGTVGRWNSLALWKLYSTVSSWGNG